MLRHVFFSAPHRVMFAGGLVQLLLALLFWVLDLAGRHAGLYPALAWDWPAPWLHAGLMIYGIFPWFVMGFLMTALPKWMQAPPLGRAQYLPAFFLLAAGWGLFDLALLAGGNFLLFGGLLCVIAGNLLGGTVLFRIMQASAADKRHARIVLMAGAAGIAGCAAHASGLLRADAFWIHAAETTGIFMALLPIFFTVIHRMLPVWAGSVIRPYRPYQPMFVLWGMLCALVLHGVLDLAGHPAWLFGPDLLAAGLVWLSLYHWGLRATLVSPLLAMLHVGVLWLAIALSAYAGQSLLLAAGMPWGGWFPLHVLTLGCFVSLLIGMITRVTLGHSGRPIESNRQAWPLFLLFQGAVILRLAGEFFSVSGLANPYLLSALLTLLVFLRWGYLYGLMYLKPRPDGMAG